MTTPTPTDTLTATFVRAVSSGHLDELAGLYTDDALFDAHVPNWRFQAAGRDAVLDVLRGWFRAPGRFAEFESEPTAAGDLLVRFEFRERDGTPEEIRTRELQLWRVEEGRISEQIVYCAGRWDGELVARMSAEAPLVRP